MKSHDFQAAPVVKKTAWNLCRRLPDAGKQFQRFQPPYKIIHIIRVFTGSALEEKNKQAYSQLGVQFLAAAMQV